ncbi:hypothetical protein [Kosmotoga sp. DU53]|uniref:hypothetical protein n=1 Tax=Kosmotoga sp. DU53 TaxID=1310160 RepID=UPI0007C463DE|nr:hypothetical protein [Kosmotoga sp. DU53]
MSKDLKILKDNKDNLLKIELAGWLHDMYKCSDEFVDKQSSSPTLSIDADKDFFFNSIKNFDICFQGAFKEKTNLFELIEEGRPGNIAKNENFPLLVKYLGRSHGAAHIEKEESRTSTELTELKRKQKSLHNQRDRVQNNLNNYQKNARKALEKKGFIPPKLESLLNRNETEIKQINKELSDIQERINSLLEEQKYQVKQNSSSTFISSVFGYEYNKTSNLTAKVEKFLKKKQVFESEDINIIRSLFSKALGDTRRPINEITLEDWSFLVATLFKSAVAGAILRAENGDEPVTANNLKWRFLSIRIDSEQVFSNSVSISDLLARKKWITEGLDRIKKLIEEEYPMGNEVYRDDDGSIFVVPDINDILKYKISDVKSAFGPNSGVTFEDVIRANIGYEGEITPEIKLSESWFGQKPPGESDLKDELPPIGKIIGKKPVSPADPIKIAYYWSKNQNKQVCRISWLRPEDDSIRHVSKFWTDKIKGRARTWLKEKNTTIWIDEIADATSKVALISAKFDIANWISETEDKLSFIRTLNYETPPTSKHYQECAKNPSFARIRRVWETTSKFWDETLAEIKEVVGTIDARLIVKGKLNNLNHLNENSAYEAEVDGTKFTVFLTKTVQSEIEVAKLIVIENLKLLAQKMQLGEKQNNYDLMDKVWGKIHDKCIKLYDADDPLKILAKLKICDHEIDSCSFSPVIEISKAPERFMVLVPANKALEVAKMIKKKYEKEMGKVRNRLPMNLGIVYARYHTALPAIIDAGRRFMRLNNKQETWRLAKQPDEFPDHFKLSFENGQIWKIPSKMGDGSKDIWYPYFYVVNNEKAELENRSLSFKGPSGEWLIHVSELMMGDEILVIPSYFDFEYLSSASQRFEISYNDKNNKVQRRSDNRKQRPYYLDDLDDIEMVWATLSTKLSNSQIKKLNSLVEKKRRDWASSLEDNDEVFKAYVEYVVDNLKWKPSLSNDERKKIIDFCVNGKLSDVLEIHMSILKDKTGVIE